MRWIVCGDKYIAEIVHDDEEGRHCTQAQQEANADVLAASPELLEAAKYLVSECISQATVGGTYAISLMALRGLERAIAKAERRP